MTPVNTVAIERGEQTGESLWPLRLKPYPDELFSSWLVRLAREYEMPFAAFCRAVWPTRKLRRDIDREIDDEALHLLSRKTGVSYADLFGMTLRSHEEQACPGNEELARELYFRDHRTDLAIRFCSECLFGPDEYFRKDWRLDFFTLCPEHWVPLKEGCPRCGAACLFAGVPFHYPLSSCHCCHRSLRYSERSARKGELNKEQLTDQMYFQEQMLRMVAWKRNR